MSNNRQSQTDRAMLALELTMRDALEGMEELASLDMYWFESSCLEIISIEPAPAERARVTPIPQPESMAKILAFPEKARRAG